MQQADAAEGKELGATADDHRCPLELRPPALLKGTPECEAALRAWREQGQRAEVEGEPREHGQKTEARSVGQ